MPVTSPGSTLLKMTEFSVDADRRRGHSGEDRTAFFAGDERAGGGDLLLSGGIAGAQASIFQRASVTASETLPLLDKIDVLSWESNNRDISRLKNLIRSGFAEVVGELSMPGGPPRTRWGQARFPGGGDWWHRWPGR